MVKTAFANAQDCKEKANPHMTASPHPKGGLVPPVATEIRFCSMRIMSQRCSLCIEPHNLRMILREAFDHLQNNITTSKCAAERSLHLDPALQAWEAFRTAFVLVRIVLQINLVKSANMIQIRSCCHSVQSQPSETLSEGVQHHHKLDHACLCPEWGYINTQK